VAVAVKASERPMFEQMMTADRVRAAKEKTQRVVDHLLHLLALHENNAIVVYSPTLASQIPRSYAANAFNMFQESLHRFEIVRLCALWDLPSPDRESIPTIVRLVNDSRVIDALVEETRSSWSSKVPANPSEDPELDAAVRDRLGQLNELRAKEKTAEARVGISRSIERGQEIEGSVCLAGVKNLRDRHLAHSLSASSHDKTRPVPPMQYGDERKLLLESIPLVEDLHLWVNCTGFSFDKSREIARRNAEALWNHCKLDIES
jgi:AbiU2